MQTGTSVRTPVAPVTVWKRPRPPTRASTLPPPPAERTLPYSTLRRTRTGYPTTCMAAGASGMGGNDVTRPGALRSESPTSQCARPRRPAPINQLLPWILSRATPGVGGTRPPAPPKSLSVVRTDRRRASRGTHCAGRDNRKNIHHPQSLVKCTAHLSSKTFRRSRTILPVCVRLATCTPSSGRPLDGMGWHSTERMF